MPVISADERCVACGPGCLLQMSRLQRPKRQRWRELRERRLSSCTGAGGARELRRAGPFLAPDPSQIRHARQRVAHLCSHVGIGWILWAGRVELESSISCVECPRRPSLNVCSSGGRVKQLRAQCRSAAREVQPGFCSGVKTKVNIKFPCHQCTRTLQCTVRPGH